MSEIKSNMTCDWLCTGDEVFPAMLAAIDAAQKSVRVEIYIFAAGPIGERFRDALVRARQRGLMVKVLIDGLGSVSLPGNFFDPLRDAGGEARVFNPSTLNRLGIRNHRKLLVCDEQIVFIGGFNIAPEYEGDGVKRGWCDIGMKIEGPLVAQLAASFDEMFLRAEFRHKFFMRLRKFGAKKTIVAQAEQILLNGPGRGQSPIQGAMRKDLAQARNVQIIVAYFLPTWGLRRDLVRVARRGGKVQLILAGKSDVLLSQLAGRSFYRRLLKAGVEIYEYQPQILHAKLIIVDGVVYVGSANLDPRSLDINYELMIRFEHTEMAEKAREVFTNTLGHCHQVTREEWRKSRTIWRRLKQHWAHFLLARIDPWLAKWQWRTLPD